MRTLPLLAAALALGTTAQAQAPDANTEIRAAAQAFDDAQLKGDRAALEAMLAPDFLFVLGSGRVGGRRDFIEGFTNPNARLQPFEISDRLFIRVSPDVAILGGEARVKGTENGKPIAEHFRFSDTFAKRDGRWVVVYVHVTGLPGK